MQQDNFLQELLKRADEQQLVLHDVPFPKLFLFVSRRLGTFPWRIILIVSVAITLCMHLLEGKSFDESVLWLFGSI